MTVISTTKGYDVARWLADCCFSSCRSNDWCGKLRSYVNQDSSRSILLPRSIADSLIVVYYSGAGVVPKGNPEQIKAIFSTIAMHVTRLLSLHVFGGRLHTALFLE